MNNAAGYIGYQLRELKKDNLIGSVFTDPNNPDDFIAGYVRMVNARTALVASITPYGKFDGFFGIRVACVLEVQYDNVYAERLELLMRLMNEVIPSPPIREDEDALVYLMTDAMKNGRVITLWTASETYVGFVSQVNDLYLTLSPVDFMGQQCAEMTFRLNDIEMVSAGSEEERMYELLDHYYAEQGGQ